MRLPQRTSDGAKGGDHARGKRAVHRRRTGRAQRRLTENGVANETGNRHTGGIRLRFHERGFLLVKARLECDLALSGFAAAAGHLRSPSPSSHRRHGRLRARGPAPKSLVAVQGANALVDGFPKGEPKSPYGRSRCRNTDRGPGCENPGRGIEGARKPLVWFPKGTKALWSWFSAETLTAETPGPRIGLYGAFRTSRGWNGGGN